MHYQSGFGGVPGAPAPPPQHGLPNMQQGFAGGTFTYFICKVDLKIKVLVQPE